MPSGPALGCPEQSITKSAPKPPTISRTAAMRASGVVTLVMSTVASAPNLRASASRGSSGAPTQITRPAPISCAAATARMPIGPEPWITTVSPHLKPPAFVDAPEMMVNLAGQPGERVQYPKVKVSLEVKDAPVVALIAPSMPRVTDIFQTYLRELRPVDLNGSAGMFRLKEELTRRVNLAVAPQQVNAVLFKEVVIQ